jgi:hypothetical protein
MSGCSDQSKCTFYVLFMLLVNGVAIAMVVIGAINTGMSGQLYSRTLINNTVKPLILKKAHRVSN